LAQGACMATEDAIVLAEKAAASPDDPGKAFKAYEQERYLRTGRTQIMERVYGEVYHARGVTAELREMALSPRTPEESYEGIAWLYGGPVLGCLHLRIGRRLIEVGVPGAVAV